jgi:HD-like signal output (HDOD) protein
MNAFIEDRLRRIEFLPTFPTIVGEVMNVLADPKSSASDLVRRMDPSLVGEVLKAANGALQRKGNSRGIATVEQAIAAIGYADLSSLILQTPFLSMVENEDLLFDRYGFMRHSVACAILARTVSTIFKMGNPDTVYVSGMLHDIGIIVIHQYFRKESELIGTLMREKKVSRLEAEKEIFSMDHALMGSLLLETWGIPEGIVESVKLHHTPEETGDKEDAYAVWLADSLAMEIDFERDLSEFQVFFAKQREALEAAMPDRFLLRSHIELFEAAHDQLRRIKPILGSSPEAQA